MRIKDLELFIQIAETGSITSASVGLNLSVATASAGLKRLENQLGAELFVRSPRHLRLSTAGEHFLSYCHESLRSLDEGKQAVLSLKSRIEGEIRISSASDIGRNLLLPLLDEIMDNQPNLTVHVALSDHINDLYQDRIDAALRYIEPEDSNLVAFHLASMPRYLCASPYYLEMHPPIKSPQDLRKHNCLLYRSGTRIFNDWTFNHKIQVKVSGNRVSDDGEVVRRWALADKGIMIKPLLDIGEDLEKERLTTILPEYRPSPRNLWLFCPGRNHASPSVLYLKDQLKIKINNLLDKYSKLKFLK